ncbi:putative LPS assembly protein LptD [Blattabacterium cuenoti]|uniref:putative LPS assembly protein LptD n=1 Tax=Blattabacterium cuenoti TaxID=1653831 RepID=UPI00163D1D73|nr:putative LPS assembly protein LptD [Blattabacterium cuenoti]
MLKITKSIILFGKEILFFFFLSFFLFAKEEKNNKSILSESENPILEIGNLTKNKFKNIIKYSSNTQEHNIKEGKSYLNGNAFIEYLDTKIEADWIEFNWKNGDLNAKSIKNKYITVIQGNRKFLTKNFFINLNDKKGEANDVCIQEKNHVIIANNIKKENNGTSLMKKVIYTSDPLFIEKKDTNPDFYLKTNSLKYFHHQKSIITGPVFFYWYKVPLPIVFPFLYMKENKNSFYGIKFPKLRIKNKKIYIENIGLFFPISNYFNFTVFSSIYGNEKWKLETEIKYKLKNTIYKNNNGLIHFNYQRFSNKKFDYQFKWKHNKKFNSDIEFSADINYLTSNRLFTKKSHEVYVSNMNIKKKFDNHSLLNISAYLIQKMNKGETKLKIPEIRFSMHRNHFLEKKNTFIRQFIFDYQITAYNSIIYENPIFLLKRTKQKMDFQTEMNHTINMATYVHFSPFLKISPKIHYNYNVFYPRNFYSKWTFKTSNVVSTDIISNPLYLEIINKKNFILRHEIEPMLSFYYNITPLPNFFKLKKNSYEKKINLVLRNNLELKKFDSKNTENKIKILEFFQVSTSYIFDPPFFKWENIHFIGYTNFTKYLGIKYKGGIYFDEKYEKKEKINKYFDFSFHYNFIKNEMNIFSKNKKNKHEKRGKNRYECFLFDRDNYANYSIPLNFKINLNSNFYEKNTEKFFHTFLSVNGSIEITKYWKIDIHTNYDILKQKIMLANIIFYRDLRSFKMNFNWSPIGDRYWSFFIGIKDPMLSNILQYNEERHY